MATRVFELARELGVRSKDVLEKCRAEGIELKNHMASLSAGLEETIRDWFSEEAPGTEHTAVETTKHVDLEKAREKAKKTRRRKTKKQLEDEAIAEALAKEQEKQAEEEVAKAEEAATAVAAVEAETPVAEEVTEQPATTAEPVAVAELVAEKEEPAEEPVEEPVEEPEEEPEEKPIVPAGPQVVPKPAQLQGPRVVRVEKPDYSPRPQPRQSYYGETPMMGGGRRGGSLADERNRTGSGPAAPVAGARGGAKQGPDAKKGTKRSPRRKTGRTGDAKVVGEKLKEWRNKDLQERADRIAGAGHGLRRRRATVSRGGHVVSAGAKTGKVEIEEPITIKGLSAVTGIKSTEIIKKLMGMGTMATINQTIETELAETIMLEFDIELVVAKAKTAEDELMEKLQAREKGEMATRAPVVTFLGHVDHGKTSLLDYIRKSTVASGEAGGITQAIGSYRHDFEDKHVVFLDTPGHEAFTAMRSRGASMTDVVVLVVAADDGVMPQTVEAISHAKAAGVPIVVALNKIDVSNANIQRALGQLAEHGLQPREWGGETEVIHTSAETGEGIDELVELLSLEAEILELKAEADAPASGYVIEAQMDPGKGVLTTLLNLDGTLRIGDVIMAGRGFGKVRQIYDDKGKPIKIAPPSTPIAITGLDEVPEAGDRFFVLPDLEKARSVAEERRSMDRARELAAASNAPTSLEELFGKIEAGEIHELPVLIKADVQGSIEALTGSLIKINTDEVKLNIIHTAVGGISTGDVTLAEASGALIIGFNVVADANARRLAEEKGVEIRLYRVIYEIIEDMRKALEEGLTPEIKEESLGRAEVRQVFKISRLGTIAGCYVVEGVAQRNAKVRIIRNNVVLEDERSLDSLKRIKDDAREVKAGLECGLKVAGYDDIKEGDILEFYKKVEIARTL
ncbi:MAG: translation initiation factor IF-2 [Phycisphaerae bacterium]|nr:translation initiation factor IF-2 [Phycisphaerae bacterium]